MHNGSVFHPAAVVFPRGAGGGAGARPLRPRAARGLGRRLRGRHPRRRIPRPLALPDLPHHRHRGHPRRRGGRRPSAAASTRSGCCHAFGSAGTQAAGLWEFLRDAADSKQLHTAHAARPRPDVGLPRARRAHRRPPHPRRRARPGRGHVERRRSGAADRPPGRALGAGRDLVQVPRLVPAHPSGRRRAAAGDAGARPARRPTSARVTAHVHQGAIDVLGPVVDPQTVHQAKFSMGTVLGLSPCRGAAGLGEFEGDYRDADVVALRERVAHEARRRSRCRLPEALDRQGHGRDRTTAARSPAGSTSPRATPATA